MESRAQTTLISGTDCYPQGIVACQQDEGGDNGIKTRAPADHKQETLLQEGKEDQQQRNVEGEGAGHVQGDANDKKAKSKKRPEWKNVSLYCPVSGALHSNLLDFKMDQCPMCDQVIAKAKKSLSQQPESESEAESESEVEDPTAENAGPDAELVNIQHAVEYKDAGGLTITVKDWARSFNLDEARHQAMAKLKDNPILKVVTVLTTSVPRNSSWLPFEVERLEQDMPLIENPKYSFAISSRKLVVLSRPFISALQEVCLYDTGRMLEAETIEFEEPYSVIAHHLDELGAYKQRLERNIVDNAVESTSSDKETCDHLGVVLDYINEIFQDRIRHEVARYGKEPAMCTHRMLWFLFKPGRTVYVENDGNWDACVVESVDMGDNVLSSLSAKVEPCVLSLWCLDFDGRYVTRVRTSATIHPFSGEKPITSLKVVPSECFDEHDGGALRVRLENEGRKWYGLLKGSQVHYSGELASRGKKWLDGRVFVDSAAYNELEYEPSFERVSDDVATANVMETNSRGQWIGYDDIDTRKVKSLDLPPDALSPRDHRYLLCSRYLKGFVFNTRTWETLNVAFCQSPKLDRAPFERLVMPEEQKLMIKALVYKYTDPRYAGSDSQQVWAADFIKNKGEGQIFLLHGGPGVGKTFTAECIAEFTGRPLLAITCGDLGTDEVSMERELGKWLKLAHKWGAVMLIDEADVFLEKRMESDVKRNSLVSVFLREIEYYQGILFLTTNRVGQFDDAFISRIHIVIHYPDLSDDYRRQIWNQFFDKLQDDRGDLIKIDRSARRYVLEEPTVSNHKWNGREIRNAFQTAVALAEYRYLTKPDAEKSEGEVAVLYQKDFKQVCEMAMNFKKYLTDVNEGYDEQQRAHRLHARLADEDTI